jgi:Flp pilus assembly protein TadG
MKRDAAFARVWSSIGPVRSAKRVVAPCGGEKNLLRRRGKRPLRRAAGSYRLNDSGATMLEYALDAPMLLLMLVKIVDLGIMLTTQSLLDGAARDAARLIRTGQVAAAGNTISTFQNLLCSRMAPVMSTGTCQSQLIFDVEVFNSFGGVAFTPCTLNNNQVGVGTVCKFTPGNATNIVGVQVTYNRQFIVPWVGACLGGGSCWLGAGTPLGSTPGNAIPLISTVVFRNEPFPSAG